MRTRVYCRLLALVLCLVGGAPADADVIWDFESGSDHGFALWSVNPPVPIADDPARAGDEALTGGLPNAGIAWCIGRPDQYDGFKPPVQEGDKVKADGTMEYNQPGKNHPFTFPVNNRGQQSYLSTYNLTQYGDAVNSQQNDQIATSPLVLLQAGAVLTVWAHGGGSGTHAPVLDPNPAQGYTNGSSGIAVLSAQDGSLLAGVYTDGHGTLKEHVLDLSSLAGRKVYIEVVDAFEGGWGWLAVDEIRIANAIGLGSQPGLAGQPVPADGATDVPLDAVLSWTPGEFAMTHDVYLGASFDDVNTADRDNPKGVLLSRGRSTNSYEPADVLQFGQTYYWRIDEVNAPPDSTIFKGNVWSFTTEPYAYPLSNVIATASSSLNANSGPEKTVDGSGLNAADEHGTTATAIWTSAVGQEPPVWIQYEFDKAYKLHQMWVWNSNNTLEWLAGLGVKTATIEYSMDGTVWTALANVPEFAQAPGTANYVHNTTVEFGGVTAKFVRITCTSSWSGRGQCGLSEVRFLYIPVSARYPTPATGATGVSPDTILTWRAGREAVSHEVYLGTDPGTLTLTDTVSTSSYSPADLLLGTRYYWRIDEVNAAEAVSTWTGDLWSFTIADRVSVDDFESYTNDSPKRVFQTWIDGLGFSADEFFPNGHNGNGTGAMIGYNPAAGNIMEYTIVHGGRQSMPFAYDGPSETTRTFAPAQDWTRGGITTLVLFFQGDPTNTAGELYVKINGTKVAYSGNAADLAAGEWKQWNIALPAAAGLGSVKTLTIGISSGQGTLCIDDIQLK